MSASLRFVAAVVVSAYLLCSGEATAQTINRSISDATTPPGIANGAQLGAFPLSDLESVDLFSGALNFSIPIKNVGGRGEASYSITIPVENRWQVYEQVDQSGSSIIYPNLLGSGIGYAAGVLSIKQIPVYNFCGSFPFITYLSTRFHFTLPNGEEHDLMDAQSSGTPQPSGLICFNGLPNGQITPYNRGRNFISYDGSQVSFVADADVIDDVSGSTTLSRAGFVYRKDGTRYRIDSHGTVEYMEDRNGNLIRFSFCSDPAHDNPGNPCTDSSSDHDPYLRPVRIIDPLGRTIQIEYAYPSNSVHPNEDRIIFTGASGQRTIKIRYLLLESVLRNGNMSIANVNELFPSAAYGGDAANVNNYPNDPLVISQIVLPNDLEYSFRYNQYGELARATLPTGGYFEYDWLPYTASVVM